MVLFCLGVVLFSFRTYVGVVLVRGPVERRGKKFPEDTVTLRLLLFQRPSFCGRDGSD